jgi:hypothetical protein
VILLTAWLALGCAARAGGAQNAPGEGSSNSGSETRRSPERPLTEREQKLMAELRRDVEQLSKQIGERNTNKKWELASAADYVAGELEAAGYRLDRQGFEVGEVLAQNLGVELPGAELGHEIVIVGAHYDSGLGTPGADDNASGAAALLALARALSGSRPSRTLRLVAFANAEAPHFRTPQMGSLVYAKRSAARGEKVVAMISIESIGYYSDAPNSQRHRKQNSARYPSTGDFVAVEGNEASKALVDRVLGAFLNHASISAHGAALPADSEATGTSDEWAFWQVGYPAVTVTDTASLRNPHSRRPEDTPDKLDFARMARVVAGLQGAIGELAQMGKQQAQAAR